MFLVKSICTCGHRVENRLLVNQSYGASIVFKYHKTYQEDLPVITSPQKMIKKLQRFKLRQETKHIKGKPRHRGPLLISCHRKAYNFYRGDHFEDKDFFSLVSCGWKNKKRVGDHFSLMPHSNNPSYQSKDPLSFEDLGLNERLCFGIHQMGLEHPTLIQKIAIPSLLRGENIICAAETGSGKTLAYLLPAIQRVMEQKKLISSNQSEKKNVMLNNPQVVILTPSRELTQQVMDTAQTLQKFIDFIPHSLIGGQGLKNCVTEGIAMDVLISTPGILNKMLSATCLRGGCLQLVVIDESDTMLDDSFVSDVQSIFAKFKVTPSDGMIEDTPFLSGTQIALVSATMPRSLEEALGNIIPVDSLRRVSTRGLHNLMPHVRQQFWRINPDSKNEKLIHILKTTEPQKLVTMIFTKNNNTCVYLKKLLRENGIDCLLLSGDLNAQERQDAFSKFKEGYSDILVATDVASRGLDTTNVHRVINFDFPTFMSDYIHRVGRVGRVGSELSEGQVVSFVTYKWDVELLWKIETAARKRTKLENVNANIKRKLQSQKEAKSDPFPLD